MSGTKGIKSVAWIVIAIVFCQSTFSQISRNEFRVLKEQWGKKAFRQAHTARFSFYMGRSSKRVILYMNLARQDGEKFTELVVKPYIEKNPERKAFLINLQQTNKQMLHPSFRLWLAALPHAQISGLLGTKGHQGFETRMAISLHFKTCGENCSYGYSKSIDICLQLLNSPPHKRNILNKSFSKAAVAKCFHTKYGWNSVTTFSGK